KNPEKIKPMNKVMVTWLGRPDTNVPGGMGRQRPASLFRRVYDYAPDATGLQQVPIPVWTTKAFTSAWEVKCDEMPFEADFAYRANDPDQKVSGTLRNNLPLALEDCHLVYGNKFYPLSALPARGAAPTVVKLETQKESGMDHWVQGLAQPWRRQPYSH